MKITELKSMSLIMVLAMMIMTAFTACSDDDNEGNKTVVFLSLQTSAAQPEKLPNYLLKHLRTGNSPAMPAGANSRTANSWKASSTERPESRPLPL